MAHQVDRNPGSTVAPGFRIYRDMTDDIPLLLLPGDSRHDRRSVEFYAPGSLDDATLEAWCEANCGSDFVVLAFADRFSTQPRHITPSVMSTFVQGWFRDPLDADLFVMRWR